MKMSLLFPSNFLKKEDIPYPTQATIRSVTQEEIKGDNGNELKATINFVGNLKPMVLNKGNAVILEEAYGDDSDDWHGKTVEIYVDPNVMFGGKRVGGIRLRVPAPNAPRGDLWDVSDGQNVMARQTTEQVRAFLAGLGNAIGSCKVKAAGAPKESAKTAEVWLAAPALNPPVDSAEEIPF